MLRNVLLVGLFGALTMGCAHKGATKVECQGPLRPVNPPKTAESAPVNVEPASKAAEARAEKARP